MRMAVGGISGGGMGSGGMGDPSMGMGESENFIMTFFHSLPMWAQGILTALLVIGLAWILGIIIGKLYASVKYPDPEKPTLINPLLKIGLGAAIIVCGFWIYSSFTKPNEPVTDVVNPDGIIEEMPEGDESSSEETEDSSTDESSTEEASSQTSESSYDSEVTVAVKDLSIAG